MNIAQNQLLIKMKKKIFTIAFCIFTIILLGSCEQDDICLEDTTPRLVIRFYDNENPNDFKKVSNLLVQIQGVSEVFFNETITSSTDSIAIPIMVTDDLTKYTLVLNGNDGDETNDNPDILNFTYTREDLFVSRSCGYKTVFHEGLTSLETDTDNWILDVETIDNPQSITNQKNAHVKIFH